MGWGQVVLSVGVDLSSNAIWKASSRLAIAKNREPVVCPKRGGCGGALDMWLVDGCLGDAGGGFWIGSLSS